VGSDQSQIGPWISSLDQIVDIQPAVIVPGHGPVMRDLSYAKQMARMFRAVQEQTTAAVSRGETLEQAQKSVQLEGLQREFAGDSSLRVTLFRNYVAGPAVAAAYRELRDRKF
jgi:cyclase